MTLAGTALVTGGAVRIGRALALALARRGFAVAIHCRRSRTAAESLRADILAAGGRAAVLTGDLANTEDVEGLVPAAAEALGPVGILVNNASLFEDDRAPNVRAEVLARHMAVNLTAPVLLAQTLARGLPPGHEGLVVNLVDQRVWKLTPQYVSYTLSKAALFTATKTLAQALAPRVRVVAIAPGPTLPNESDGPAGFAQEVAGTPLARGPDLSEFESALGFFIEARSVTGQMIALDGGQHLAWRTPDIVA